MSKNRTAALISGLMFAAHPAHTESLNVVGFRSDLLATLFCLSSFIFYIKSLEPGRTEKRVLLFSASMFLYGAGMLSKDMAVTLPALFILYDLFFIADGKPRALRDRLLWYLPLAAAGVLFFAFRAHRFAYALIEKQADGTGVFARIPTVIKVYSDYVLTALFPLSLNADHGPFFIHVPAGSLIIGVVIVSACLFAAYHAFKKKRLLSFSILWFFITLLPVSNIVPLVNVFADRYIYLPSAGFCIAIGLILEKKTAASRSILFLLIIFYSAVTVARNEVWYDSVTLWSKTAKQSPHNARVLNNLGNSLSRVNDHDRAIASYRSSIDCFNKYYKGVYPDFDISQSYYGMGTAYLMKNNTDEAIKLYKQALAINPKFDRVYSDLGAVYCLRWDYKNGTEQYLKGLEVNPDNLNLRKNLANAFLFQKYYPQALKEYEKVLALTPNDEKAAEKCRQLREFLSKTLAGTDKSVK